MPLFELDLWWCLKYATIGPPFVFGWTYGGVWKTPLQVSKKKKKKKAGAIVVCFQTLL